MGTATRGWGFTSVLISGRDKGVEFHCPSLQSCADEGAG